MSNIYIPPLSILLLKHSIAHMLADVLVIIILRLLPINPRIGEKNSIKVVLRIDFLGRDSLL